MSSLITLIATKKREAGNLRRLLAVCEEEVRELENARADCTHEWDNGHPGWEHEGKYCIHCGINDQYAPNHKKMVEAERKFRAAKVI